MTSVATAAAMMVTTAIIWKVRAGSIPAGWIAFERMAGLTTTM